MLSLKDLQLFFPVLKKNCLIKTKFFFASFLIPISRIICNHSTILTGTSFIQLDFIFTIYI